VRLRNLGQGHRSHARAGIDEEEESRTASIIVITEDIDIKESASEHKNILSIWSSDSVEDAFAHPEQIFLDSDCGHFCSDSLGKCRDPNQSPSSTATSSLQVNNALVNVIFVIIAASARVSLLRLPFLPHS